MMKIKLAIGALVVAGLAGSTFSAEAKTYKPSKHQSSMTTGANMKSSTMKSKRGSTAANPSSSGNVGPGTSNNQGPAPGGR